jgi:hypothetical protein
LITIEDRRRTLNPQSAVVVVAVTAVGRALDVTVTDVQNQGADAERAREELMSRYNQYEL